MNALSGLTSEHNAQIAQLKLNHPEVKFPSLFTEIFDLPKMSTSTPERKKPESKSPVLDVSRDSLDISNGVEPVSPPGMISSLDKDRKFIAGSINPYDADFNMYMMTPKDTSDYGTSANSSDIDSGTNRLDSSN